MYSARVRVHCGGCGKKTWMHRVVRPTGVSYAWDEPEGVEWTLPIFTFAMGGCGGAGGGVAGFITGYEEALRAHAAALAGAKREWLQNDTHDVACSPACHEAINLANAVGHNCASHIGVLDARCPLHWSAID